MKRKNKMLPGDRRGVSRVLSICAAALCITASASSYAAPANSAKSDDEEYNFNWLDPEKKIYVLQNRKYLKTERLLLSLMVGKGLSSPYRTVYTVDPRIAYYFNETWGIEAFYTFGFNSPNVNDRQLNLASPSAFPEVREINSVIGGMVHYVPWYAKINVFNQILYFDWYFAAGLGNLSSDVVFRNNNSGTVTTTPDSRVALLLATGHQYHVSQNFTVRLDVTGAYYRAPLSIGANSAESTTFSTYNFSLGVGFRP